jgi:hypothetical protein
MIVRVVERRCFSHHTRRSHRYRCVLCYQRSSRLGLSRTRLDTRLPGARASDADELLDRRANAIESLWALRVASALCVIQSRRAIPEQHRQHVLQLCGHRDSASSRRRRRRTTRTTTSARHVGCIRDAADATGDGSAFVRQSADNAFAGAGESARRATRTRCALADCSTRHRLLHLSRDDADGEARAVDRWRVADDSRHNRGQRAAAAATIHSDSRSRSMFSVVVDGWIELMF